MAPLSLLITASHLTPCPGLSEAEEMLGNISRVILSEADVSAVIRWSVPPPLSPPPSPWSSYSFCRRFWKLSEKSLGLAGSSKSSIHSSLVFIGIKLFFSKTDFDHQEIVPLDCEWGNCTVLNSLCIVSSSQVTNFFDVIGLKVQHMVWHFTR